MAYRLLNKPYFIKTSGDYRTTIIIQLNPGQYLIPLIYKYI
jgi:hypothetical protein